MPVALLFILSAALTVHGHVQVAALLPVVSLLAGLSARLRVALLAAAVAGIVSAHSWLSDALAARVPPVAQAQVETVSGYVADLPERLPGFPGQPDGWRFTLVLEQPLLQAPAARRLRVSWYPARPRQLCHDQPVRVALLPAPPRGLHNRYGADSERTLLGHGIDGYGRVHTLQPRGPCASLREEISRDLRQQLAGYPLAAAMVPALVVADRRFLEPHHWQRLRRTGTVHLVAISGLHISLVALFVGYLAHRLISLCLSGSGGVVHSALLAMPVACAAALMYAWLAGFSAPTLRALAMAWLVLASRAAGVSLSSSRLLVGAAAMLVLFDPGLLLLHGFWLSVLAVALLCLLAGLPRPVLQGHALMTLALGPLAGHWFGFWSLTSLAANLVMVPVFTLLVVPLALIGALWPTLGVLPWLAHLLETSWLLLGVFARPAGLPLPATGVLALALACAALRWLRPGLPVSSWPLLVVPLLLLPAIQQRPAHGSFSLRVFDVGQGQALAVQTRHTLLFYDAGPSDTVAQRHLLPWLLRQPQKRRFLVLSHGDQDHAGGLQPLLSDGGFRWLLAGESVSGAPASSCTRGQRWTFDGVRVSVLWPPRGQASQSSNNRSCVLHVQGNEYAALLTGDIEKSVEYWLLGNGLPAVDVVTVPHHGSGSSSSFPLIRRVKARYALVSAGWNSRYGHPLPAISTRWREHGAVVLDTARHGALFFPASGTGLVMPSRQRSLDQQPWRQGLPVVE